MENGGKRILIVEDEVLLAMDLELLLKEMGHSVVGCVLTGRDALSLIENDRPDIILIDITLQGDMDGITTAKRIRQRQDIPIVFVTGNKDRDTLNRVNEFNPVGIVIKPLTDNTLRDVLEKAFVC